MLVLQLKLLLEMQMLPIFLAVWSAAHKHVRAHVQAPPTADKAFDLFKTKLSLPVWM